MTDEIHDRDLGAISWDREYEWWEGSLRTKSGDSWRLLVLARTGFSPDRAITEASRATIARIRDTEETCRRYAAGELLHMCNEEWNDGPALTTDEFISRLTPDSIEVHESGYAEVHYGDGKLFRDHGVGVRIRPDGSFQEAVLEG
jgi:hypothetical protein